MPEEVMQNKCLKSCLNNLLFMITFGVPKGPKNNSLGCQRASIKTHHGTVRNSVSVKRQSGYRKYTEMTQALVQHIIKHRFKNGSETCLGNHAKNMCSRKVKPCKSIGNYTYIEGLAKWVWDHENDQQHSSKYIITLTK